MHEFLRLGLVRHVSPDRALRGVDRNGFESTFLELCEPRTNATAPRWIEIHGGKMSYSIFKELKSMGLARSAAGNHWGNWYMVEEVTAKAFMAYLAGVISGKNPGMTPVTDSSKHVADLSLGINQKQKLESLRFRVIKDGLPCPSGLVKPYQLAEFKDKHKAELQICRDYMDTQLMSLARSTSDDDLIDHELSIRIRSMRAEVYDASLQLEAGMRTKGWKGATQANIGAVTAAGLASASALTAGGSLLSTAFALGAAALALVDPYRIHVASEAQSAPKSPLLYAALACDISAQTS